jgi:hypothetical protein
LEKHWWKYRETALTGASVLWAIKSSIPGILRTIPVAHPAIPAFISESK